jgi:RecB family exonuclease
MTAILFSSARSDARLQRARTWLAAHPASEPLLVLATGVEAATAVCIEVLGTRGASLGWSRTTIGRLAVELAGEELARQGLAPAGALAVEAVLARVIHRLAGQQQLGRYTPVAEAPGLARALAATVSELRLAGITAGEIESTDPDLARVLTGYQEQLQAWDLTDRAGVLQLAIRMVAGGTRNPWLGHSLLLLDLPVTTAVEGELVAVLAARAPQVLATVPDGDQRTLATLQEQLGVAPASVETAEEPCGAFNLGRLQAHLFSGTGKITEADDSVVVVSAPDMSRECMEIMRRICEHARQGTPFDRMAVLLRSPEEYRPYLEEAFARTEVPAYFSRGVVRPDPAGRAFLSLLRCASENLSAHRFAEYLSLAQVPPTEDGRPPAPGERWTTPDEELVPERIAEHLRRLGSESGDAAEEEDPRPEIGQEAEDAAPAGSLRAPRRWERLLVEAAVIGGRERWQRRLDGLEAELRLDLEEAEDPAGPFAEQVERDLAHLHHLRSYALPLIDELARLPDTACWGAWLDCLGDLATRSLRQPERVLSVLAGLAPLREVGPVELTEVCRVLERHLLELRVALAGHRWGKVWVGPLEMVRGSSFDVVFLPGLAERLFPHPIAEDPVLLDAHRQTLDQALVTNRERVGEERLALRLGAGAARVQVVLSWPRLDLDQGRPRVPSFYALEAVRAAEGQLPGYGELARRADITQTRIGWPAPQQAEEAVDDAEYDLALLHQLVDQQPATTSGAAHYLLSANPHLARALRSRGRRWLPAWTAADGLVDPGDSARQAIAEHRLSRRSFSPTALQQYAKCPYLFYLYAVLRLAPREEVQAIDEMDALQRGSLVHEVLYELMLQLRERNLLPVTGARLDTARELLDQVLETVTIRYHEDLAPAIERVWEVGVESVRADLREWLRRQSEDQSGFVPWRFELSFGLPRRRMSDTRHSRQEAVALDCGIQLRGSVDLVEQHRDGTLRVTDYKTGKVWVTKGAVIDGGEALQPVLYALAVEQMHAGSRVASGRLYYCTVAGGYDEREVVLDNQARQAAEQVAAAVDGFLEQGFLPAAPRPRACLYCDYQLLCGNREELRVRRKPADRLALLNSLRELP